MRALERYLLLQIIDTLWREHLYDMDYLREGIHLRGFAQIDPLIAYKNEAFELFTDLMNSIWTKFAQMIFNVEVEVEGRAAPAPQPRRRSGAAAGRRRAPAAAASPTRAARAPRSRARWPRRPAPRRSSPDGYTDGNGDGEGALPPVVEQRHLSEEEQIGRNDPCWCGSGKKFKKCHGA